MSFENLLIAQGEPPDIVDETGAPAVTYLGWVLPGTVATNQPNFKIKRITNAAAITITTWADGDTEFNNIWDNRAALVYSFLK